MLIAFISAMRDSKKYAVEYKATIRNDREHVLLKKFRAERNCYLSSTVLLLYLLIEKLLKSIVSTTKSSNISVNNRDTVIASEGYTFDAENINQN